MNDNDLKLVLASLERRRPGIRPHLQAMMAFRADPAAAEAASAVLTALLEEHDDGEQARWVLRDLLHLVDVKGQLYYALRYGITDAVKRIAIAAELDITKVMWFGSSATDDNAGNNWKGQP